MKTLAIHFGPAVGT